MVTLIAPASYASPTPTRSPKAAVPKAAVPKAAVTKKAVVKKIPVRKITPKRSIGLSPSPSSKWPPASFKSNGEVFAKIPTAKELISAASSNPALTRQLAQTVEGVRVCEKYSCAAVQVAAVNGCSYWEVNSKIVGEISTEDKTLRTISLVRVLANKTTAKQVLTILIISQEAIELHHQIAGISANCHHDVSSEKIPSTSFSPVDN